MTRALVLHGDCLQVLQALPDNAFDAMVCDPPSGISFMGKAWDTDKGGRDAWIAWLASVMAQCHRVLKPGAHAFVWALPRTSYWTAMAIDNGGFEIRDRVHHVFGSGMPHAKDLSKAVDQKLGTFDQRPVVGTYRVGGNAGLSTEEKGGTYGVAVGTAPAVELTRTTGGSPEAQAMDGWHTNLKPGCEDWWLARKAPEGTLADNVLAWGTGGLNIDACRIARDWTKRGEAWTRSGKSKKPDAPKIAAPPGQGMILHPGGSWPAHLAFSHSAWCDESGCAEHCPVRSLPPDAIDYFSIFYAPKTSRKEREAGCESIPLKPPGESTGRKEGSKGLQNPHAGANRTNGAHNDHPTVKNLELMRWLVKLITPPGRIILDPFAGSGSTGCAAVLEGFEFLGIEQDAHSVEIAKARIDYWAGQRKEGVAA